jgi:hypothetical protein
LRLIMLGGYNYDSGLKRKGGGRAEAEFMDKIQTKVLTVFLVAIHSQLHSLALKFLFLQTRTTSYVFLQPQATSNVFLQFSYCAL